ncbi:sulfite exporter TauE/SafE family protein [Desulfothermus okinawensis JCM 13304]
MLEIKWLEVAGQTYHISALVYFLWCIWVGWIFSTVGAFGGIMAGVGHLSILGIGKWASSLKGTHVKIGSYTDAGKFVVDNVRFSNNLVTLINSTSSTINWYTQKRLVWPAGIALGVGAIFGAQVAIWTTGGALGVKLYKGLFGICTLLVSLYMFYQLTPHAKQQKSAGKAAAQRFKKRVEELKSQGRLDELEGVENLKLTSKAAEFDFFNEHFEVKHYVPFGFGLLVGFIATLIGVGGGFLLVPFLTAIGLPMFIAPGISALAVILNQISAVAGWFMKGQIFPVAVIVGWFGILIGSYIGPRTQKYLPMGFMYGLFGVLAFYVGIRYILAGFWGIHLPPA